MEKYNNTFAQLLAPELCTLNYIMEQPTNEDGFIVLPIEDIEKFSFNGLTNPWLKDSIKSLEKQNVLSIIRRQHKFFIKVNNEKVKKLSLDYYKDLLTMDAYEELINLLKINDINTDKMMYCFL